jgi:hypothetical protein
MWEVPVSTLAVYALGVVIVAALIVRMGHAKGEPTVPVLFAALIMAALWPLLFFGLLAAMIIAPGKVIGTPEPKPESTGDPDLDVLMTKLQQWSAQHREDI